ncbi:MAG TPA: efflux RND transporter periplasmic adaptor subunit [Terracidiphilus sp.]
MNQESNPKPHAAASHDESPAPDLAATSPRKAVIGVILGLLVFAVLAVVGILSRMHDRTVLAETTQRIAAPTVIALPAKPGAPTDTYTLPGNVTAFTDSPIFARTSGYLTRWYFDIGAHVKQGALLAEISAPEVDQQLAQAEADLGTAQANASNAKIQADRYSGLVQTNAVSRQDTDTFINQAAATAAAVRSAQANVQRLRQLQSYEKICAPFDGVVTARTIDTGQLIDAGAARELFHLQAIHTLRVYVNLPQSAAASAKQGAKISITFPERPGQTYTGTLVRTSNAIDPMSRTLLVELDVDNRNGELLPGSLAQVHFKAAAVGPTYVVPAAAVIFRRTGIQVGTVVDSPNGPIAHLATVIIGQDDGATVQIVHGINPGDKVIQDPPDSLIEGQRVTPVTAATEPNAGGR